MNELVEYLKQGNNTVLVYDKESKKHFNKKIFRHYIALGKIPKFDPNHKKSYMFHGAEGPKELLELPHAFQDAIKNIKKIDSRYNQFVINLYETGNNFIEPHSDCDKDMVDDYSILILSLGQERILRLSDRNDCNEYEDILLKDNSIYILDKNTNKTKRHEILKSETNNSRISITARMMK